MFLPTITSDLDERGWDQLDVILVSGDTYIDVPSDGCALLGRYLERHGFRVGIIAQPDCNSDKDILRLGHPRLFWGVTGGSLDSMVANYTALGKRRQRDDLTPGGNNDRRPDRAVIRYSNLIRHYSKGIPVIIGGIEASLRRLAHYDFWSNSIRRSLLLDSKADILVYGMAEAPLLALAQAFDNNKSFNDIPGICYMSKEPPGGSLMLPSFEDVVQTPGAFQEMFLTFYQNTESESSSVLVQKYGNRYLVINKPPASPKQEELDSYYDSPFMRDAHPWYATQGEIRALDTVRFSVTTHRGCYGECSFCAIAVHQGRRVVSRSEDSILREVEQCSLHPRFKGTISDLGGPTANMYGFECKRKILNGVCPDKRCMGESVCPSLPVSHKSYIDLLQKARSVPGVKHVFVSSGIRYDLVNRDTKYGQLFLEELAKYHVSGQLRVAPEHVNEDVLSIMGKPGTGELEQFRKNFQQAVKKSGKDSYLTYYFIAAHPGCGSDQMKELSLYATQKLKTRPQGVQVFTPTPSTFSTLMYYTGKDPVTGKNLFVERNREKKEQQKLLVTGEQKIRKKR